MGFKVEKLIKSNQVKEEDVKIMKKWITVENLPKYSEEMIALFLLACDNNVDEAKTCASNYYLYRNNCPEIFTSRNINNPEFKNQFDVM